MIARQIISQILDSLRNFPVVGILGPRQVGKTTLAREILRNRSGSAIYLDLERASDRGKLERAELFLEKHAGDLVILDEVQRMPELFPLMRALVDSDGRNGRFLVLGSASPDLSRQAAESLAGRIYYHHLDPLLMSEVGAEAATIERLWSRGGYPRSFLAESDIASFRWREAFIQTHLERDIPSLGIHIPASLLMRFWQMLAHCHGQLWNASKIAGSLGVSPPTARHYLDTLQDTFMLRQLQPYHTNTKKRLIKSPKIYLCDSGLLHSLLGIMDYKTLLGHPAAGASWEGWVIQQILSVIPTHWRTYFYRTSAGAECDLIIQPMVGRPVIAVEIKFSLEPRPTRGFWSAFADLNPEAGFVVYPGKEIYPLSEKVSALPATEIRKIISAV
jgi:uncharacterized protein